MKKYIDVEEAEKVFKQMEENDVELYGGVHISECFDADRALDALKEIPAANVKEVGTCENCKHRDVNHNYGKKGYLRLKAYCKLDTGDLFELGRNAEDDKWFCADWEPKDKEVKEDDPV